MFDGIINTARTAGAPAILTFPLALLAEVEFRRGKIAAAYAPAREFTQLAAETGQAFYLACRHWAGSRLSSATMRIVGRTSRLDPNSPVEPART
jgi:hypothetical protein